MLCCNTAGTQWGGKGSWCQDRRASQARLRKYNYPLGHEGPAHIFKKGVMKCGQVGVSVGLRGKE